MRRANSGRRQMGSGDFACEGNRDAEKLQRNRSYRRVLAVIAALAAAPIWASSAHAATVTWDTNPTNPAAPNDGSGNWNTTTNANWTDGIGDFVWVNGDVANIGSGGTAGTITIDDGAGTVQAAGINFNGVASGNYTVDASAGKTLTLVGAGNINLASGVSPTISAPIAGNVGLTVDGPGTLNLTGNNTFTAAAAINSGTVVVGSGGNLGASTNAVSLGSGTTSVGALTIDTGVTTTIGSFVCATNSSNTNVLTINSGATLNINSNLAATGVNGVFVVGAQNNLSGILTKINVTGAGTMNVTGGANNSSFVVGVGNTTTSANFMTPNLDMSGLNNFTFTTGLNAPSATVGGNEFIVGVGTNAGVGSVNGDAFAKLAANSSITAGTVSIGDSSIPTPGTTGTPANMGSGGADLYLGSGANTINANNILVGNGRTVGNLQWFTGVNTGSVTIAGGTGGASKANMTVGTFVSTGGTPAGSASDINLFSHTANVQAGTVILGNQAGGTGGTSTTKGGKLEFDTGTFTVDNVKLAVATAGSGGAIAGTLTVGKSANSTGIFNVNTSFSIAANTGGTSGSRGNFVVNGGTANINCNILDVSTANTANVITTLTLSGGTLNMMGNAIGPVVPITGGSSRHISTITLPTLGNNAVLMNLGGTGINDAGLTMNGTGTLILEGNNTYSGGTTISSGALQVGQASDVVAPTSALQAAVTNNSILALGSSQSMSVATVISGTGGVNQVGTGVTTLTGSSSYTGATSLVGGTLSVGALPNAGAGGSNSVIGASSNAAAKLVFTGGTLQYTGAGGSTDRLFTVTPTGGAIDASGTGAINFNNGGAVVAADPASRAGTTSAANPRVTLANVADLVAGMTVSGTNILPGTTILSINPTSSSITLSLQPTVAGADTLSFGTTGRTLTLTGSSTANNTLGNALADSAGNGALGVNKTGAGTWILGASNTYTGATTVQAGKLTVQPSAIPANNAVVVSGGEYQMTNGTAFKLASLNIDTTGRASVAADGNRTLHVDNLTVGAAGTLDLNDNDLVVNNGSFTTIKSAVLTGFGNPPGPGIVSSTSDGSQILALFDNALIGATDWQGVPIGANAVVGKYTYFGDVNFDGQVTGDDYTIIDSNLNTTPPVGLEWLSGDANLDGIVTGDDYTTIDSNLGLGVGNPLSASSLSTVPEPATLLWCVGGAGLLALRRRKAQHL